MIQETKNELTNGNCGPAIEMATRLYKSSYVDNEIRMLYASAHACNIGIELYTLIDDITSADFTSQDAIFKTLVRLFPSKAETDSKLESAVYAQDGLHSMIVPGTVIGPSDSFAAGGLNTGSVLLRDRTDDANIYLTFTSMALVGSALNRHGYTAAQDPITFGYAQQQSLPWTSIALVKTDATHQGCALASGLLNMLDGIEVLGQQAPGSVATSLNLITSTLTTATEAAAHFICDPSFSVSVCNAAIQRLRYHDSCWESDPMAASAAGIIQMINLGWN